VFLNGEDNRDGMVLFRHLGDFVPATWARGLRWQVEYHSHNDRGFPAAMAWVIAPATGAPMPEGSRPWVMYIIVVDDERRKGIGTKLLQAIRDRWPDAILTDAISDAGAALLGKFRRKKPKHATR
jgi:GNAT superfamily N-acetyltransferase